jgi:hypothetical protein
VFELKKQCLIEHVNARRPSNDDSPVAVDIKISVEDLPAKAAAFVLRADKVVEDPPENYIDALSKRLHTSTSVLLEQEPELDLKQPTDKPGEAGKRPGKVTKREPEQRALVN